MDVLIAVALMMGAYGLSRRKVWGAKILVGWLILVIPLMFWDAALLALYGTVLAVSPGLHWYPTALRIAFERAALGAGFPIFLGLWLSQRHVRRRIASWSR